MSGTRLPSGRPRCDIRITFAPFLRRYSIVGSDSLRRLSLSTLPSLRGTLKSTRTMTRLPAVFRSSTNSFFPALIPTLYQPLPRFVDGVDSGVGDPLAFLITDGQNRQPTAR